MNYTDRIYGKTSIKEPVILDLIKTHSLERLKYVDQGGYYEPYCPGSAHSRFEHSMGVYLLLRKYKAPLAEQVAGLIHDVSHSAFSHCIDYVVRGESQKDQSHQDAIFERFVKESEIPAILSAHGFDLDYILEDKNFPLKETELPDLCADRLDYSLRAMVIFKVASRRSVLDLLGDLTVKDNHWVFRNFTSAKKFARLFRELNNAHYCGLDTAVMFVTVSDYLRYALQQNYITQQDLYTTDKGVLTKIKRHLKRDAHLRKLFRRMNNLIPFKNDPKDYSVRIFSKSRVVDPLFIEKGRFKRVSSRDTEWKKIVQKETRPKEYFLKFER